MMLFMAGGLEAQTLNVPVEAFTLPNGLRVTIHEDHGAPLVAVNLWYHVGSGREVAGRSGFAHLFEHMLFQGSAHVGVEKHFATVQEAGGTLNGSTNNDRTNYYDLVPSNFLETVLWLESDRMGFLLQALTQAKLDNQRDVVKNERRQNYENRPYGMVPIRLGELLYPEDHPYHWPTIGYPADLSAASVDDVKQFFTQWYHPSNASLVIAGDVNPDEAKRLVTKYFGDLPAGPVVPPYAAKPVTFADDVRDVIEDRVTLPQISVAWHTMPLWAPDDAVCDVAAEIIAQGKSSRLYQRLVYREQTAQTVAAFQSSRELAGVFQINVQAREGTSLVKMEAAIMEELSRLAREGPSDEELTRAKNGAEARGVYQLQTLLGKADRMNSYVTFRGKPDCFNEELENVRKVTAADVQRVLRAYMTRPHVILSVVPTGHKELAASAAPAPPGSAP
ncbi:MAG: insulinase family protein [Candidatus Eisenbacteria bacterium]|uniref:Insulinase family protein n=1 Tax=Eiseniibacteriota bacterium TaxID=2212470 RepID=A0A9D6LAC7_UNCEI|nr:insulinase family protein [Candidatus Eisenbacteria bacterium]MBI3539553.1 insulinase family protein [Candidatus Eisenbacteria bacterium]